MKLQFYWNNSLTSQLNTNQNNMIKWTSYTDKEYFSVYNALIVFIFIEFNQKEWCFWSFQHTFAAKAIWINFLGVKSV